VAQAACDEALRYSGQREAFGHPIGEFQAIQIKIADMATRIQAARLLTCWAADRRDKAGRADMETGMAKVLASEVAVECALTAMQVHGAYGYSREFVVERLYRDVPLMAIGEGANDIPRTVIARPRERPWESRLTPDRQGRQARSLTAAAPASACGRSGVPVERPCQAGVRFTQSPP
jgi:alkylation response protein AidB-like acyl-CoA dehydrogenase